MRKKLTYYLAMALLQASKPFNNIGNRSFARTKTAGKRNRQA